MESTHSVRNLPLHLPVSSHFTRNESFFHRVSKIAIGHHWPSLSHLFLASESLHRQGFSPLISMNQSHRRLCLSSLNTVLISEQIFGSKEMGVLLLAQLGSEASNCGRRIRSEVVKHHESLRVSQETYIGQRGVIHLKKRC